MPQASWQSAPGAAPLLGLTLPGPAEGTSGVLWLSCPSLQEGGAQAMGMRKALVWEQPCFAASPQEGASSHQTAAAAGRCQMQMRCSRKDAESMDRGRPGWIKASLFCSTKGDTVGGRQESRRSPTPDAGRLQQASWGEASQLIPRAAISTLHSPPPMSPSSAWSKGFMQRHHGVLRHPLCDSFIQDNIDPCANAINPIRGPLAPAPLSGGAG